MTYRWVRENAQRLVGEPLAVGDWSDLLVGLQRSLNARGLSDQDLWTAPERRDAAHPAAAPAQPARALNQTPMSDHADSIDQLDTADRTHTP